MADEQVTPQDNGTQPKTEKSGLFKSLSMILTLAGVASVVAGMIHVLGIFSSGLTTMRVADAVFNTVFGVLLFVCSRVLAKRKSLVVLLFGATVLLSIGYSLAVGRGFNFVIAAVGLLLIWQLISLRRSGELS